MSKMKREIKKLLGDDKYKLQFETEKPQDVF